MKRRILIVLLGLGAVAGFAAGLGRLCHHGRDRAAFENHVADVCVRAAERAKAK